MPRGWPRQNVWSTASPRKKSKPAGAWVQVVSNDTVPHLNVAILLDTEEEEEVAAAVKLAKKISKAGQPRPHFAEDPCVVVVGGSGGKRDIKGEAWARPKSQEHAHLSHKQMADFAFDTHAYPTVRSYVNQHAVVGETKRGQHGHVYNTTAAAHAQQPAASAHAKDGAGPRHGRGAGGGDTACGLVRLAVSFASNLRHPTVSLPLLHHLAACCCVLLLLHHPSV